MQQYRTSLARHRTKPSAIMDVTSLLNRPADSGILQEEACAESTPSSAVEGISTLSTAISTPSPDRRSCRTDFQTPYTSGRTRWNSGEHQHHHAPTNSEPQRRLKSKLSHLSFSERPDFDVVQDPCQPGKTHSRDVSIDSMTASRAVSSCLPRSMHLVRYVDAYEVCCCIAATCVCADLADVHAQHCHF